MNFNARSPRALAGRWTCGRSTAWRAERVRRPDLELAAAAAEALDASLNDVFAVKTSPVGDSGPFADELVDEEDILDPRQSRHLQKLFDLRDRRPLNEDEQAEMRALVAEYGRRAHEQGVRAIAQQRQVPLEHARAEIAEDFERRLAWWDKVQADPARLQALVDEALEHRRERLHG